MKNLILAVDFDGTIAKAEPDFIPRRLLPNAKDVINWLHTFCTIIIWTCRGGNNAGQAIQFLKSQSVAFDYVNQNAPGFPDGSFEASQKIYADYYIDDRAVNLYSAPVDWLLIKEFFQKIKNENRLSLTLRTLRRV